MENKPYQGNGHVSTPNPEDLELIAKSQANLLTLLARAVAERVRNRSPKKNNPTGDAEGGDGGDQRPPISES